MAGETPRAGKARKKLVSWQDDRSTGKYYESGDRSVIQGRQTAADSRLKPGQLPQPLNARLPRQDDRWADKYYASAVPPPTLQQIQRGQTRQAQPIGTPRRPAPAPVAPAPVVQPGTINAAEEINPSLDLLVDQLHRGAKAVVLCVKTGDSALLRRTRAALEMLVTRERITEEMYHEVRLSYAPSEADKAALDAKLGVPQPAGDRDVDAEGAAGTEDFLAGLRAEEEAEAAMAQAAPTQVVDTSNDVQDSPAPSYPTAPTAEDDDDSDFLAPGLKEANDELDRAVGTDEPVKVVDAEEAQAHTLPGSQKVPEGTVDLNDRPLGQVEDRAPGEVAVSEPQEAPANAGLTSGIETPAEAMPGIGDAPKPKKPGRRGGRGS